MKDGHFIDLLYRVI